MREIKFRAWDISKAKMIVVDQMTFRTNGDVFNVWDSKILDDVPGLLINPTSGILMQYTGKKDKNGVEVYGGDIIKCTDGADEINIRDSDTGIGVIEWNDEYVFWSISKIENGLGDILHKGYIEIIGNIYDNPKLLEATT